MYKKIKRRGHAPYLTKEEKPTFSGSFKTKQDVLDYIRLHSEWWTLGKLHFFTDYISDLVKDPELRLFFTKQIASLRKTLEKRLQQKLLGIGVVKKRPAVWADGEWVRQPGDIYGAPQFYRFGEGGRSKKKRKASDFMKKKY